MASMIHIPTTRAFASVALLFAFGGAAVGQDYDRPWAAPYVDYRASTPFEGHARGLSSIIRAQAAYNLMTAEALQERAEAAQEAIRTREQWTHSYFQLREANRQYRSQEEGPRPTTEDIVRYAQMGKPERLSPGEFDPVAGTISWPEALRTPAFVEGRAQVEQLFRNWIDYGNISLEDRQRIRQVTDRMMEKLQKRIEDLPPPDYLAARRFLESLDYEAYLAAR